MLIKKRWAWLMSVVLLGFLASADGHIKDDALVSVEPSIVDTGKRDIFQQALVNPIDDECIKVEEVTAKTIPIDTKSTRREEEVGEVPGGDIEVITLELEKSVSPQAFPYAIDSPPAMSYAAAMLSNCVYDVSISTAECKEFWEQSCDKDAFHQFKFGNMNVMTVCKNADRVYVAIAGTQFGNDYMTDASFLSKTMNFSKRNLSAHGGFIARAKEYSRWIKERLSGIEGIQDKEIVLTGHSLGAALATLLAHDVYEGLGLDARGGASNSLNQVKVVGFGSPSVLLDPSSYFLGHLNHLRFYNPNDPFATTLSRASGYKHVGVGLTIPDNPSRHIARAAPLLSSQNALKLLRQLPISYWGSLPPLANSRFDPRMDAHSMYSYAILADKAFSDYQQQRTEQSVISLANVERVIGKRIGASATCRLENAKVVCSSGGKVVAKFRYASDALPADHQPNACMSEVVSGNFVPGVTVNAGITVGDEMSLASAASEALILDISATDKWYEQIPTRTLTSLYLDGRSALPDICGRKPAFLQSAGTLSPERTLIRKFIHAPALFTLTKNHATPETEMVQLVQADPDFFSDANQGEWMDCRLSENSTFCPMLCKDNQACAVMKPWGPDANGVHHWVSLSKSASMKWGKDGADSWKYTITEKRTSWFSMLRHQNQATFMVVRDDPEGYLQFSN